MTEASGRERVLREAMRLFGAEGVAGTTVRAVAAAADVSPANVIHHFGSKQALRAAVDSWILEDYRSVLTGAARALVAGEVPNLGEALADPGARAYLRRALLDGGPEPTLLVQEIAVVVREGLTGLLTTGTDLDYATAQVVSLLLGPLLLGPLLPGLETAAPTHEVVQQRATADMVLLRYGILRLLDTKAATDVG